MARIAFTLRLRPDLLDEYVRRHEAVWPDMLAEIAASGRRNYSLFLDAERSRVFGVYDVDDDAAAQTYLDRSPVAQRWEAQMAPFFLDLDDRADRGAKRLPEIFTLSDQLAAAGADESTAR